MDDIADNVTQMEIPFLEGQQESTKVDTPPEFMKLEPTFDHAGPFVGFMVVIGLSLLIWVLIVFAIFEAVR